MEDGRQLVGRPLLGLAIERGAAGGAPHRLVEEAPDGRGVLFTGDRAACEKRRIELLEERHGTGNLNVAMPTLGGRQLWADELVFAGWRIQANHYTEHCRLLDPADVRRAWGSWEACRVAFEKARIARRLELTSGDAVVLLHGMGRSRHCFAELAQALREDGLEVIAVDYPSTRRSIADHAAQVSRVLDRIEGAASFSFVGHSMGGLVIRELLGSRREWMAGASVGRVVMLGTPNRGAVLADRLRDVLPYEWIAGAGGQDLVTERIARMPVPDCEIGVIAGGNGKRGYNPLIRGDDDGIVSVASTRIDGLADYLRVRGVHTVLMQNAAAIAATRHFLRTGRFSL